MRSALGAEQRGGDLAERRVGAGAQPDLREWAWRQDVAFAAEALLDAGDDALRFLGAAVGGEPARAFGEPEAHEAG